MFVYAGGTPRAAGGRWVPNAIRQVFAWLSQIWSVTQQILAAHSISVPQDSHWALLEGLRPATRRSYWRAYRAFVDWCADNNRPLSTTMQYDLALFE